MTSIYSEILASASLGEKLLCVLVDPEKFENDKAEAFLKRMPQNANYLLVGGSTATSQQTEETVKALKQHSALPVILFPGSHEQITEEADGILFLSLLSGRNPEYLIGQQIKSVSWLRDSALEILPTAYILIDGGKESAVQRVSKTEPIAQSEIKLISETALAGEFSGKKLVYLEAGSGAKNVVGSRIISEVKKNVSIPVIVGGGIRSTVQLQKVYDAGADIVVIGTAFEDDNFEQL
ncbi:geranylgeranylglyceryl/heptaprenylglyceryl phosphate synthase [Salegentibacter sp. F188]|uniref:Geranylgeranylglyceryl phosphate synthase n=1 Tax=Autumnicola patrickiae TaxID=3075591 RepID=A0ABU3E7E8_9FLAO|nr:geranylgeranylglyceryl/heptaprenylglyceryl phosphate synthase [Salegentibacter sp. F188]MDT0691909.1 geranylgeranylglyceryl/heptaprenylglyceryl phosphate synthase [Salegentibacter sp. F188]